MAHNAPVAAEVSAYESGEIRVPIKATQLLGVGYNDKVTVTIEETGEEFTGFLDSNNSFTVGVEATRRIRQLDDSIHAEATVETRTGDWNGGKSILSERWENVPHLRSRKL